MNIKIFKATKQKDLKSVLFIEEVSFNKIDKFSRKTFRYFLNKKRLWVVKVNNEIIGYFILICYKKSLRIYSIAVLPDFRNKGIGKHILQFIIEFAKFLKKDKILLEVRKSNKSKNLYKKVGFNIVKILKNYYENEDGYKMELKIKV